MSTKSQATVTGKPSKGSGPVGGNNKKPRTGKRKSCCEDKNGGDVNNSKMKMVAAAAKAPKEIVDKGGNKRGASRRRRMKERKSTSNTLTDFIMEGEESVWKIGKGSRTSNSTVQRDSIMRKDGLPFEITIPKENVATIEQRTLAGEEHKRGITKDSSKGMCDNTPGEIAKEVNPMVDGHQPTVSSTKVVCHSPPVGRNAESAASRVDAASLNHTTTKIQAVGKAMVEGKKNTANIPTLSTLPEEGAASMQTSIRNSSEQKQHCHAKDESCVAARRISGESTIAIDTNDPINNIWIDQMMNQMRDQMKQTIETKLYEQRRTADEIHRKFEEVCRENERLKELNTKKDIEIMKLKQENETLTERARLNE